MRFRVVFHCKTDDAVGRSYDERLGTVTKLPSATVVGSSRLHTHLSSTDIQTDSTVLCHEIEFPARARLEAYVDVTLTRQDLQGSAKGLIREQLDASIGRDQFNGTADFINLDVPFRRMHRQTIHDRHFDDDIRPDTQLRWSGGDHVDDKHRSPLVPVDTRTPGNGIHRIPGLVISSDPMRRLADHGDVRPCPRPGIDTSDGDITGEGVHLDGDGSFQVEWLVLGFRLDRAARCRKQEQAQQAGGAGGLEPGLHHA